MDGDQSRCRGVRPGEYVAEPPQQRLPPGPGRVEIGVADRQVGVDVGEGVRRAGLEKVSEIIPRKTAEKLFEQFGAVDSNSTPADNQPE